MRRPVGRLLPHRASPLERSPTGAAVNTSQRLSSLVPSLTYDLQTLRGDVFGGVTSAVVGLPVALAFGVASGLGALPGIYGAIAVGFFASVFGGTRSQISGPTGPMAVVMAVIVAAHADNLAGAFTIVILAGVIQILLGVLRIGRFVAFTPYSVISGFMSGIGIIIILLQTAAVPGVRHVSTGRAEMGRSSCLAWGDRRCKPRSALAIALVTLVGGRHLAEASSASSCPLSAGRLWLDHEDAARRPVADSTRRSSATCRRRLPEVQLPDFADRSTVVHAVQPALSALSLLGSLSGHPAENLDALNVLQHVPEDHFAETIDDARGIAKGLLQA